MEIEVFGRKFSLFSDPGQWEKLLGLLREYLLNPAVILAAILLTTCLGIGIFARKTGKNRLALWSGRMLVPLYFFLILSLTVLNREFGPRSAFRLLPGYLLEGGDRFHETRILMAIADFLYYIPYGFLIRRGYPKIPAGFAFLAVFATGFAAEILQSLCGVGMGTAEQALIDGFGGSAGIALCLLWERRAAR